MRTPQKQAVSLIDGQTDRETDMAKLIVAFRNLQTCLKFIFLVQVSWDSWVLYLATGCMTELPFVAGIILVSVLWSPCLLLTQPWHSGLRWLIRQWSPTPPFGVRAIGYLVPRMRIRGVMCPLLHTYFRHDAQWCTRSVSFCLRINVTDR